MKIFIRSCPDYIKSRRFMLLFLYGGIFENMKSFRKLSVILSAILISASLMTGCSGKDNSSSNSIVYYDSSSSSGAMLGDDSSSASVPDAAAQTVTEAAPPVNSVDGTIGDTLEQGGISVTLEDAAITVEKTADNTTLMYAVLNIKNTTEADIEVNRLSDFVISVDGKDAGMSAITSSTANSAAVQKLRDTDVEKLSGTAASGNSIKGYISFEIPENASEITVTYLPYKYSDTQENTLGYNFTFNKSDLK